MKYWRTILFSVVMVVVSIPLLLGVAVQIPFIQTRICDAATDYVNSSIDGRIKIGSIHLVPFHTFIIGDVSLTENSGDTLFSSRKVLVNVKSISTISDTLVINRISIDRSYAALDRDSLGVTNFKRVLGGLFSRKEDKDTASAQLPWECIRLRKCSVNELKFDFGTLYRIGRLDLALRDVVISQSIYGNIHALSLEEQSGFNIDNLSTYFLISGKTAAIRDFKYKDNWSDINIPVINLNYGNISHLGNLSDFADSVDLKIVFDKSTIGLGSAGVALKQFEDSRFGISIDGSIRGTLSDLATKNLHISTLTDGTKISIDAIVKGLPEIGRTSVKCNVKRSSTTVRDLKEILRAFSDSDLSLPEGIKNDQKIGFNCIASGTLKKIEGTVNVDADELGSVNGRFGSVLTDHRLWVAEASALNLDLKTLTGNDSFGKASAFVSGWAEMHPDSLRAEIVTAEINRLDFKGYRYSNISGGCTINDNHYDAELSSLDTNLYFKLMADLVLGEDGSSRLEGSGNFSRVDFGALHLTKMDTCTTRFMVDFNTNVSSDNKYTGRIEIRDMLARLGSDIFNIGHVAVNSTEEDDSFYTGYIESSLLSASYRGTDYIYNIGTDIASLITAQLDHVIPRFETDTPRKEGTWGELTLTTGDLKPVCALIPQDIYINEGTKVKVKVNNHDQFDISVNSDLLAFGDKFIKDMDLRVKGQNGPVDVTFTSDMLQSGETTIDRDTVRATISENSVTTHLSYNDRNARLGTGQLNALIQFPDTLYAGEKVTAGILPSTMVIDSSRIDVCPSRIAMFKDGSIKVDNFMITKRDSYLQVDGIYGGSQTDTLSLTLKDFDLNGLNFLFRKDVRLGGIFNGKCRSTALKGRNFSFLADFTGHDVTSDGENIGDIRLLSKWDENNQKINFLLNNTIEGRKPLNMFGNYNPDKKDLYLKLDVDSLNIGWIDPFLVGVMDHSEGTASGQLEVSGKIDDLKMKSSGMRLNQLHTNLSYTCVPYILDGPFDIDQNRIFMDRMTISDLKGSTGKIMGNYWLKGKNKGKIDLLFDLKSIHGLNTTYQNANQGFYGDAIASGKIRVHGPMRGLVIDINIATEEGIVHIPLDEASSVKKRDILTFVDRSSHVQSAYDSILILRNLAKEAKQGRKTGVKCNINLKASPLTNIIVDINHSTGDKASVTGTGQVEIKTGEGLFDIRGNYLVQEGNCHFSILGITAKDFTINEGGSINFVGPVLQTDFRLAASYQTKAAIETLLGDTQSVGNRRTVNCVINVNGKIDNPEIKFKIDIPDLDPSHKAMLESALSTDEKNLRQGLALLISGGFIPDQQSGIVNNSTFLYSNASEIVSNQLSNIFHQLNIPIDLGLKYQPGSYGVNIFDVAISTQLFNNRVTINGSIGNKEYSSTGSTNNLVGNVDVGIKLNKTGQWKLNLFSHAADIYSNYLDQSQRNGAGITYQEEFATFRELWELMFKRKRKQADR